jgi:hypothetical protein
LRQNRDVEDPPAPTPEEHEQAPDLQEEHESMGGHGRDENDPADE